MRPCIECAHCLRKGLMEHEWRTFECGAPENFKDVHNPVLGKPLPQPLYQFCNVQRNMTGGCGSGGAWFVAKEAVAA